MSRGSLAIYAAKKLDVHTSILALVERGVTHAVVIGHLGRAPERKYLASGKAITTGSMAVSWGKGEERTTEWVNFTAFDQTAERLADYDKGAALCLVGKIGTDEWTGKDGTPRTSGKLLVWEVCEPAGGGIKPPVARMNQQALDAGAEVVDPDCPF